jgi:hypothetical protein
MSKTFSKEIDKISVSVFPRLFCFIAFSGGYQRWELKSTTKTFCKKIVSKKITKKSKTDFFSIFLSRFRAFLGEGSSKTPFKKCHTKKSKSDPGPFLASDPPTHHRGHRFCLAAPCPTRNSELRTRATTRGRAERAGAVSPKTQHQSKTQDVLCAIKQRPSRVLCGMWYVLSICAIDI